MTASQAIHDPAAQARAAGLDPARLPRHVGLIMDGNGRWAQRRGWERFLGHRRGADALRNATTACVQLGIARLTVYAFSSENWQRPRREVDQLMELLAEYVRGETPTMLENNVRLEAIGQLARLPEFARQALDQARRATAACTGTVLCLALSYGGRDELVEACRSLAAAAARGELDPAAIDANRVRDALWLADDVDVVIRTAGEQRVSNFLPWQAAYAEYIACPTLWPDFAAADLHACLREFQARDRRFGRIGGA
jgi:undecaprenyl diphosphate synthase